MGLIEEGDLGRVERVVENLHHLGLVHRARRDALSTNEVLLERQIVLDVPLASHDDMPRVERVLKRALRA